MAHATGILPTALAPLSELASTRPGTDNGHDVSTELPDNATCLGCGYLLRGLQSHICPECGRDFVPSNPKTYGPRTDSWFLRWFARAPPFWIIIGLLLLAIRFIVQQSKPQGVWFDTRMFRGGLETFAVLAFLIAFGDYFLRCVAMMIRRIWFRHSPALTKLRRGTWRWWVIPACIALWISVMATEWPTRLRFLLSKGAFDRFGSEWRAGVDVSTKQPQWIGLFRVYEIQEYYGALTFITSSAEETSEYSEAWIAFDDQSTPHLTEFQILGPWYVCTAAY